jgi:hypothetical protein
MKELNTFRQFLTEAKDEKVSEDKIEAAIKATLEKEGGAAGIDPLKKAVKDLDVDTDFDIEKFLKKMSNVEKHKNGDYILTPLKENDEVLDEILDETAFDGFGDYRSKKEKEDDQEKLALLDDPIEEAVNYPNMLKMFGVEEALKMMVTKMRDAIKSGKVKDSELGTIEDMGEMVGKMFVKAAEDAIEANKE